MYIKNIYFIHIKLYMYNLQAYKLYTHKYYIYINKILYCFILYFSNIDFSLIQKYASIVQGMGDPWDTNRDKSFLHSTRGETGN